MTRRNYTAALQSERCKADITLRDSSGSQCMRKAVIGTLCRQHDAMRRCSQRGSEIEREGEINQMDTKITNNTTERPWAITTEFAEIVPFTIVRADDTGGTIADVFGDSNEEAEGNAKLIITAVNAWDNVAALRRRIIQLNAQGEALVKFEIEADGSYSGGVLFFCSTECRSIAPLPSTESRTFQDGTQPLTDLEPETVCDNCGKLITPPEKLAELREFARN